MRMYVCMWSTVYDRLCVHSILIILLCVPAYIHCVLCVCACFRVDWCFCCMTAIILRLFFTDPTFSSSMKEDVYASLAAAPFDTATNKLVADHLMSLLSVAKDPPVASPQQFLFTLTQLQQCSGDPTSTSASALHCLIAMLQYFKYHQQLTLPGVSEMVTAACRVLFPVTLSNASSIQDLATPTFKALTLEQTLEYAILLLECLLQTAVETELVIEMVLKILGSQLHLRKTKVLFIQLVCVSLCSMLHMYRKLFLLKLNEMCAFLHAFWFILCMHNMEID